MSGLSAETYEKLIESLPDAIVVADRDGKIVVVNSQAEKLFDYTRDQLLGEEIEILVPERSRNLWARKRDGTEFPAEISLSTIETDDGLLVMAAVRDVTDRINAHGDTEQLESRRRQHQSERLESLGQLAGGVAHDFNNLLAVILNYAAFVEEETVREDVRKDVQEIQRAAERAAELTRQLLIFGRREVVRPEVLDLNTVIRDLDKIFQRTLGEHIELRTKLADGLWPVDADPSQMEQVLMNLLINARDAMERGGVLVVQSENVELDEEVGTSHSNMPVGTCVRITVADSGRGMPEEVKARALEPFYTTKPKGEGAGLGLATVYGIVSQAGGDITIYSQPDEGTAVKFYLPANKEALPFRKSEESGPVEGGDETILVVEDEDAVRELSRRILAKRGYRVLTAPDPPKALEILAGSEETIDLLLTDVIMPGMSGPDLADHVRHTRPEAQVLFMSGYPEDIVARRGALEPGMELLQKPFNARALLTKVRELLDRVPVGR